MHEPDQRFLEASHFVMLLLFRRAAFGLLHVVFQVGRGRDQRDVVVIPKRARDELTTLVALSSLFEVLSSQVAGVSSILEVLSSQVAFFSSLFDVLTSKSTLIVWVVPIEQH